MPIAPGTWGSLPPVVAFSIMLHFGAPALAITLVMAAFIVAGSVACVLCVPAVAALVGKGDPGEVVVDEVAGQAVAYLIIAFLLPSDLSLKQCCLVTGLGFFLFRALDITKPWPIKKMEAFPEGWGVLADDLLAGVLAGIILLIGVKLLVTA